MSGVKVLGAPIGSDEFVEGSLREQMNLIEDLLDTVAEMKGPHIFTEIHRMCAFVVQIIQIFRATPLEQTIPLFDEYDARQAAWIDRLMPDIPSLSPAAYVQNSIDHEDGGLGLLPERVVVISPYVGSETDTTRAVALLPRQGIVTLMTAHHLHSLFSLHDEHGVAPTIFFSSPPFSAQEPGT